LCAIFLDCLQMLNFVFAYILGLLIIFHMKKLAVFAFTVFCSLATLSFGQRVDRVTEAIAKNPEKEFLVYVFEIKEEIGPPVVFKAQRAFEEADSLGADFILIHMNTYGGLVESADSLRTRLLQSEIPVIVFVDNNAAIARCCAAQGRFGFVQTLHEFIAFFALGLAQYRQPDMDGFLIRAMKVINAMSESQIATMRLHFVRAMWAATKIFGKDAFRKRYLVAAGRLPINKALFEAVAVNLAALSDVQIQELATKNGEVRNGLIALCTDRAFESAISQGTGDVAKVNRRFQMVQGLFQTVLG